jgi:hypothetical protein
LVYSVKEELDKERTIKMMYILTQEEFDALQEKNDKILKDSKKILQDLCTRVANSEPLQEGWMKGKPWGCIITADDHEWYCDECPVQDLCPNEWKEWSK